VGADTVEEETNDAADDVAISFVCDIEVRGVVVDESDMSKDQAI
jgi:hypothetical protein